MKNIKKLISVCIFLVTIATISCSKELDKKELHITENVFTVEEGLEVRVSIFDKTEPSESLTFLREFEGVFANDEMIQATKGQSSCENNYFLKTEYSVIKKM